MLTFNLKKEWFEKIKSGEKTHEYREVKDYWTKRIIKDLFNLKTSKIQNIYKEEILKDLRTTTKSLLPILICFMNGMISEENKPRIYARLKTIRIINGLNTDLKINKPVYDIEFELTL